MKSPATDSVTVPRRGRRPGAGFLLAVVGGAAPVLAQCQPTWTAYPLAGPPRRNNGVFELAGHDEDGSGPIPAALYAGESCMFFAGEPYRTARFDGWAWSTVPDVDDDFIPGAHSPNYRSFFDLLSVRDGVSLSPAGLYAGGIITYSGRQRLSPRIARLAGASWWSVGPGVSGSPDGLEVFDEDGALPTPGALFIGGGFASAGGDPSIRKIARWDGQRFSSVGHPVTGLQVLTLCESSLGPFPSALFVGGSFSGFGPLEAHNIARWDGQQWTGLGQAKGVDAEVRALTVFDEDGPGPMHPALFVGGAFTRTNAEPRVQFNGGLARWDGQNWSAIPGFTFGTIIAMAVFDDDGLGPNRESLFVSGPALEINGQPANGIARWDGRQWHLLEGGLSGFGVFSSAETMCAFDEDGPGPSPGGLYIGGPFDRVNGVQSTGFARWGCPLPARCYADCDQSTGPNALDIFDFLCYFNRYELDDPSACDCDASTGARVCDIFDFLCFQNAFAAGCP